MNYTAVRDTVDISLHEVKTWLRLSDTLVAKVDALAPIGSTTLQLSDVEFLNKGQYLTINGISYKLESIDYTAKTVVISEQTEEAIAKNTPVGYHPHDALLLHLIKATKSHADEYLNNPFPLGVPEEVKTWCLKKIALDYDRPEAGISRMQFDEYASKTYGADIYEEIDHLRFYPL